MTDRSSRPEGARRRSWIGKYKDKDKTEKDSPSPGLPTPQEGRELSYDHPLSISTASPDASTSTHTPSGGGLPFKRSSSSTSLDSTRESMERTQSAHHSAFHPEASPRHFTRRWSPVALQSSRIIARGSSKLAFSPTPGRSATQGRWTHSRSIVLDAPFAESRVLLPQCPYDPYANSSI